MPGLTVNLFDDYASFCCLELIKAGYQSPNGTSDDIVRAFLNVHHRRVPVRRRKVFKAPYATPEPLKRGERHFLSDVAAGRDLRKYQSTRLMNLNFNDGMLNDFGIQHFHLGTKPHPSLPGFKDRTDPVLFALVRPDVFYALGLYSHGAWSERALLDVIHANWPEAIAMFVAKGTLALQQSYTDAEYAALREARINAFSARPDGTIHMAPGLGITTAGGSTLVSIGMTDIQRALDSAQQGLAKAVLREVLQGRIQYPIELHLSWEGETMLAANQDCKFELGKGWKPEAI